MGPTWMSQRCRITTKTNRVGNQTRAVLPICSWRVEHIDITITSVKLKAEVVLLRFNTRQHSNKFQCVEAPFSTLPLLIRFFFESHLLNHVNGTKEQSSALNFTRGLQWVKSKKGWQHCAILKLLLKSGQNIFDSIRRIMVRYRSGGVLWTLPPKDIYKHEHPATRNDKEDHRE